MNNSFNSKYGEWAVVTGASSGIGLSCASQLRKHGLKIVLVARSEDKLQSSAVALGNENTKIVVANLATQAGLAKLEADTAELDVGLVVHSAGAIELGAFTQCVETDLDEMIQVHVTATTSIAHVFAKRFKERSQGGGIILVSSGFAFTPVPWIAVYAACKAYMLSLGEALAVELKNHNIDVLTVAPGSTKTNMASEIERKIDFSKLPLPFDTPDNVARVAITALGKKDSVVPGAINKVMAFQMDRLLGRTLSKNMIGWMLSRAFRTKPV